MRDDLEQRAKELALYMIENRTTVRAAALSHTSLP